MKRVKALPRHAVDDHSQCDYHPLVVCSCGACRNKEAIECKGKAYKTRFRLDCKFHALLYEIECHERANQAEELIHPILKRGHSNALEASHKSVYQVSVKGCFLTEGRLSLVHQSGSIAGKFDIHARIIWHQLPLDS